MSRICASTDLVALSARREDLSRPCLRPIASFRRRPLLLVALDPRAVKGERIDQREHGVEILQRCNVIKSDKDADKSSERERKLFAPEYEPASLDYGIWNE